MRAKGTYLLLIRLEDDTEIAIGRLGRYAFGAGWYAYAGSALGPGGLAARLARHQRKEKSLHWHIDYLLATSNLETGWQVACPDRMECIWAAAVRQLPDAQVPVAGFGSSDCSCPAHLIYWPLRPLHSMLTNALARMLPPGALLQPIPYPSSNTR
jgi:Uri superfamily endonuclease